MRSFREGLLLKQKIIAFQKRVKESGCDCGEGRREWSVCMGAFVTVLAERSGLCVLVRGGTEKMKIIAGIPAHNNKKCIGSLLLGVKKQVDEIIVVDDGSTDDTVEIVEECDKMLKEKNNSSFGKAFLFKKVLSTNF